MTSGIRNKLHWNLVVVMELITFVFEICVSNGNYEPLCRKQTFEGVKQSDTASLLLHTHSDGMRLNLVFVSIFDFPPLSVELDWLAATSRHTASCKPSTFPVTEDAWANIGHDPISQTSFAHDGKNDNTFNVSFSSQGICDISECFKRLWEK